MDHDASPVPTAVAALGQAPNLHFHQLAYLVAVQEAPTLTAAAQRLGISQPALSQALTELERRLDVALFERVGRRRVLTEAGRTLAEFARESLGRAAELDRRLSGYRTGTAGRLRVGMIDAANLYLLPEAIRTLRREHPLVELTVAVDSSGALMERVAGFELDLAVVVGPPAAGLAATMLGGEPLYLYGPSAPRSAVGNGTAEGSAAGGSAAEGSATGGGSTVGGGTDATAQDGRATWALYPPGSRTRAAIDAGLARVDVRVRAALESGNPQILRQHVALGLGWSVLPRDVAEPGAAALLPVRPEPVAHREIVLVTRPSVAAEPLVAAFLRLAEVEGRARLAERHP